jgi:ABC-2 type transport system permease protein
MLFLCGLFVPLHDLPVFIQPLSFIFPLTYGVDILHFAIQDQNVLPLVLDFGVLIGFCVILFLISLRNIHQRWIL